MSRRPNGTVRANGFTVHGARARLTRRAAEKLRFCCAPRENISDFS
jgi:hypothetical protein